PMRAAVGRFINTVAPGRTLAIIRLARADPNHIGLRLRHRDVADGRNRLIVEDGFPRKSAVDALPHARRRGTRVDDVRIAFDDGEIVGAAAGNRGTDLAEMQRFEQIDALRGGERSGSNQDRRAFHSDLVYYYRRRSHARDGCG